MGFSQTRNSLKVSQPCGLKNDLLCSRPLRACSHLENRREEGKAAGIRRATGCRPSHQPQWPCGAYPLDPHKDQGRSCTWSDCGQVLEEVLCPEISRQTKKKCVKGTRRNNVSTQSGKLPIPDGDGLSPPSLDVARFLSRLLKHAGDVLGQVARDVLFSCALKSRCRSGVPQEVRPVVSVTTSSPRLSLRSLCQSLPGDGVPLTHSPEGGDQRYRHTRGAHSTASGRLAVAVRERSLWVASLGK